MVFDFFHLFDSATTAALDHDITNVVTDPHAHTHFLFGPKKSQATSFCDMVVVDQGISDKVNGKEAVGRAHYYVAPDYSKANSEYKEEGDENGYDFDSAKAEVPGTGYYCSAGHHKPGEKVVWCGFFKGQRKKLSAIKLRWVYAPGRIAVKTSPDGVKWVTAVEDHEIKEKSDQFSHLIALDKQRSTVGFCLEMSEPHQKDGFIGLGEALAIR